MPEWDALVKTMLLENECRFEVSSFTKKKAPKKFLSYEKYKLMNKK